MTEFLTSLAWFLLFAGGGIYLAYQRISLLTATVATGAAVAGYSIYTITGNGSWLWMLVLWAVLGVMIALNMVTE